MEPLTAGVVKFKSPLEELTKSKRGRSRPPWRKFAPHGERYHVTRLEGEKPTLGVDKVAAILHATPSALCRAMREPDFPMPPANPWPLRWTEGQIERLLWRHRTTMSTCRKCNARHPKTERSAR